MKLTSYDCELRVVSRGFGAHDLSRLLNVYRPIKRTNQLSVKEKWAPVHVYILSRGFENLVIANPSSLGQHTFQSELLEV